MKQRLHYIDALRGLAALFVLICHSIQIDEALSLPYTFKNTLEAGKYGVQLFFIISALTMFYSLNIGDSNTKNFYIRRFFRIAPLYFLAVCFYARIYKSNSEGIFLNLTFLHGFSPSYINSIVPGGWSIGIEMIFYLFIPILFKFINTFKKALYFLFITLIISFIFLYCYKKLFVSTSANESFIYFWLPNQLPVFAVGFVLYFLIFKKENCSVKEALFPLISINLLVAFSLVTKLSIFRDHILFAFSFGIFIYILAHLPFKLIVNKTTLFLGKISYSLYLSQYAVIEFLKKTGFYSFIPDEKFLSGIFNVCINLFFLFSGTIILSYILYHFIEIPFQRVGQQLINKKKAKYSFLTLTLKK